ncbi:UNVERIFIED_CONTAM: hypothetical protein FKN15_016068 [Acipenser sinensis]
MEEVSSQAQTSMLWDDIWTTCRPAMQPPQSYSVGGQHSSGQLIGKPASARPVYRGCWFAASRGHPGRPILSPPGRRSANCTLPLGNSSMVGSGIAWTRTDDLQAIAHPALHADRLYQTCNSGAPWHPHV